MITFNDKCTVLRTTDYSARLKWEFLTRVASLKFCGLKSEKWLKSDPLSPITLALAAVFPKNQPGGAAVRNSLLGDTLVFATLFEKTQRMSLTPELTVNFIVIFLFLTFEMP